MRGNFSILEIHCWILLLSKDISGGWLLKWVGWTMNWGMKQWRLLALIHFRKRRRASALWVDNLKARECFQREERKKRKKITAIANEIDTYAGWWQRLGCQKVRNRCIEFHPKTGVSRDRAVSCFLGFISSSRDLILVVVFRSKVFFFGHYFVFLLQLHFTYLYWCPQIFRYGWWSPTCCWYGELHHGHFIILKPPVFRLFLCWMWVVSYFFCWWIYFLATNWRVRFLP